MEAEMCDDLYYHTALGSYPMEGGVVDRPRCNGLPASVADTINEINAGAWIDGSKIASSGVTMTATPKEMPDTPHYDADDEARQTDRNTLGNVIQRVTGKDRESMKREVWRVDQVISTGDMLGKLVDGKPRDERKALYDAAADVLHKRIVGEK
jgi:hypothetical protein